MIEISNAQFFCLVAPDGTPQVATLADEYALSMAVCNLLAKSGMGQPVAELFEQGYEVLPVKLTITQNGTAEDAFQMAKSKT
jgi:hypothetical protein